MHRPGRARGLAGAGTAALAVLLAACGADDPVGDGTTAVATLEGEVTAFYGLVDGPDSLMFARIGGILPTPEGEVWVVDAGASAVRRFALDGSPLGWFGGAGEGPGELQSPCCPGADPGGGVWIRDAGNGRYQRFETGPDGPRAAATISMAHGAAQLFTRTTIPEPGRLVDVGERPGAAGGALERVRFHRDVEGAALGEDVIVHPPPEQTGTFSVDVPTDQGRSTYFVHQPFGPRFLFDSGPLGGWASAVSSRYEVRWVLPDGTERRVMGAAEPGPSLSEAERERARTAIDRDAERLGVRPAGLPYGVPDHKPPMEALLLDADGRLWVLLARADGAAHREADIWRPDGTREARVSWPAAVDPVTLGWAGGTELYGIHRGELGVERGARVELREVEAAGSAGNEPDPAR